MSTEAESTPVPQETTPATHTTPTVTELKPKNTHRLNRILRKPKASLPPRKWHPDGEGEPRAVGVPPSVVNTLLASLSEEEKQRAAAGLDPLSATQEALIRRAARFGLNINKSNPAAPVTPAPTFVVDEPSLYKGDIWYTPIKEEWYYQIEILKLEIGGQSLNLDCREYNADKAIVDSGTTLLRLPQKVFNAVVEAVARTSLIPEFSDGFWTGSQLACWTNSETPWSYFPKISIYLRDENSSQSFRITILPQLYIQPMMGAGLNYECYRFGISPSTNALVIGATVMEGFYVVFDRARKRVGFAASPCAEIAGAPVSEISGPFSTDDIASNCVPALPLNEPILWIVSYTLMSVCGIILLILIVLLLLPFRCRHLPRDPEVVNDESSLVRHRWK